MPGIKPISRTGPWSRSRFLTYHEAFSRPFGTPGSPVESLRGPGFTLMSVQTRYMPESVRSSDTSRFIVGDVAFVTPPPEAFPTLLPRITARGDFQSFTYGRFLDERRRHPELSSADIMNRLFYEDLANARSRGLYVPRGNEPPARLDLMARPSMEYHETSFYGDYHPRAGGSLLIDRDAPLRVLEEPDNAAKLAKMGLPHGPLAAARAELLEAAQLDLLAEARKQGIPAYEFGPRTGNPSWYDTVRDLDLLHEDAKGGNTRSDAKGGDAGSGTAVSETPVSEAPQNPGGPRIVLNPAVFHDKRDALCVAMNEAFRLVMEENGFEPVSEPTEKQRKFFADTAYANDELQLRRTILARIATLDTSVSDPTDEQLEETAEMLEMVMEVGAPQNEWEQSAVQRLHDVVAKSLESTRVNGSGTPPPPEEEGSAQAAEGAGVPAPSFADLTAPAPEEEPDDIEGWTARSVVKRSRAAYEAARGAGAPVSAPPAYTDDPEEHRLYQRDAAELSKLRSLHELGALDRDRYEARLADSAALRRMAAREFSNWRYANAPKLEPYRPGGVSDPPEFSFGRLWRSAKAGALEGVSQIVRALQPAHGRRVGRGPENLGSLMYEGGAVDRLADQLALAASRARLARQEPGDRLVSGLSSMAPYVMGAYALGPAAPVLYASVAGSETDLGYDRAWAATGGVDPETLGLPWYARRGTAVASQLVLAAAAAAAGPLVRRGFGRAAQYATRSPVRAVVPYDPLVAALNTAPRSLSGGARAFDTATGYGVYLGADRLLPPAE